MDGRVAQLLKSFTLDQKLGDRDQLSTIRRSLSGKSVQAGDELTELKITEIGVEQL